MKIEDLTDAAIDGMDECKLDATTCQAFGLSQSDIPAMSPTDARKMETRLSELGLAERYGETLEELLLPDTDFEAVIYSGQDDGE